MRGISKTRLRAFWETPGFADAEGPLRAWHTHVSDKSVAWYSWADVKAEFGTASLVGNCVVFNVGETNTDWQLASCIPARRSSF